MAGGRPRKPHQLRVLEGGAGKHRPLTPDLAAPNEPLVAPEHLTDEQRREWDRHVEMVRKLGTESSIDAGTFEGMIVALVRARECDAYIATHGVSYETDKGNTVMRPEAALSSQCWERYNKFATQFGLTPTARVKLSGSPAKPLEGAGDVPPELRDASV